MVPQPTEVLANTLAVYSSQLLTNTIKIHLMSDDVAITADTLITDMPADLAGDLAPQTLADPWNQGIDPETGLPTLEYSSLVDFTTSAITPPISVYGYWISNSAGTNPLGYAKFDNPVTFDKAGGQTLNVVPRLNCKEMDVAPLVSFLG